MHRLLRLQHHRHTGQVLHHRHTSYRALALVLALAGLVMIKVEISLRQVAVADSLFVYATVPAETPTTPAVILQPTDGTTVSDPSLSISGSCPVTNPVVTVAIYDNTILAGSTPCVGGSFSLTITLASGSNLLVAKTFTITGGSGSDSAPVRVTYTPPVTPVTPGSSNSGSASQSGQPPSNGSGQTVPGSLTINSDQPFITFGPGKAAEWIGSISGGTAPYTVTIDWGDTISTSYKNIGAGSQHFTHTYTTYMPYVLRVSARDKAGDSGTEQFAAVTPYVPPLIGNILAGTPKNGGISNHTLFGLYGVYLLTLSGFGLLWLLGHRAYAPVPVVMDHAKQAKQRQNRAANRRRSAGRKRP